MVNVVPSSETTPEMRLETPEACEADPWVRAVLDGADFAVLATDPHGSIRFAAGAVRRHLGYEPAELAGRSLTQLTDPADLARRARTLSRELGRLVEPGWEALSLRARDGRPDDGEWTAACKDGGSFTGRLTVTAARQRDGALAGFTFVARDDSGRRRVEEALRESEDRFRGAFEHSAVGMALVSPEGNWVQVNPALCGMLGYTQAELLRLSFVDVSHPADVGVSITRDCELLGGASDSYQIHKRYLHKDGRVVWAMLNVTLVRGPDRRPLHFVAQVVDVTAQRRAEEALRESEERFRDLFENASDLILCADARGRLVYVNQAWCEKLGYSEEESRSLPLDQAVHPEDLGQFRQTFERLRAGEAVGTLEARFVTRDGRAVVVEGDVSCSFRDGKPALVRGIFRDVTERRGFEAVLEEYQRSLEQANGRLAEANSLLEELATTDALTGLKNRLVLQEKLEDEFRRAKRYDEPLALVLLDVDRFKSFNDSFGHPAGDVVLQRVAALLRETARDTDVVARFGGEEFAVLMPNTERDGALALAERFRLALEQEPWERRPVTASFGVAVCGPDTADSSALVSAADSALYRAKQAGRNLVAQ